jgi:hypothetical protein
MPAIIPEHANPDTARPTINIFDVCAKPESKDPISKISIQARKTSLLDQSL